MKFSTLYSQTPKDANFHEQENTTYPNHSKKSPGRFFRRGAFLRDLTLQKNLRLFRGRLKIFQCALLRQIVVLLSENKMNFI